MGFHHELQRHVLILSFFINRPFAYAGPFDAACQARDHQLSDILDSVAGGALASVRIGWVTLENWRGGAGQGCSFR